MSDWFAVPGTSVAHGFPARAWFRSLCGEVRWTAALEPGLSLRHCRGCSLLDTGVEVNVAPVRHVDGAAKKAAIARARARRRWKRTT